LDISWGFPVWVLSISVILSLPVSSKAARATGWSMIVPVNLSPEILEDPLRFRFRYAGYLSDPLTADISRNRRHRE